MIFPPRLSVPIDQISGHLPRQLTIGDAPVVADRVGASGMPCTNHPTFPATVPADGGIIGEALALDTGNYRVCGSRSTRCGAE
ncbi:hypothetical protein [[Phormidium] sp. ETS-05]|uniref:hypothetical protein n=1 Tax=[Phormidium] sp. ETS-05 TaxID=222819 RepID=UPI0018EEFB97|nr:hypothetical protein [[Phormidium] sp. ETS-05]